jgi:hypothetical protein
MRGDLYGTRELLEYGVDPNRVGTKVGKLVPGMDHGWTYKSPLHILPNTNFVRYSHTSSLRWYESEEQTERAKIERLLIKHGGLDFVVDEARTRRSSCLIEYVLDDFDSEDENAMEF